MDDSPIKLEKILEQAPKWTFAGDFTLLQWMKQISQDLESKATKTSDALTKLNNNIKSTNIALDNVANRLITLQFGNQFVECRVQDDDETLINSGEQSKNKENQAETTVTSKELLSTFLDNNLKVLRNCHERYSIDLDDSDDEEISKEKTCIYRPINPYNEKPLPYIFGSKDWHSKWHVGLYENEQDNSYSGDEMSEAFSETSSTSHLDDNESFESNTEWASSNSIDNDNLNANIEVKNASSLRGSQALHPSTPVPINAVKNKPATVSASSSVSTTPSSMTKTPMQTKEQKEDLTTSKRSESMNSVNSRASSKKTALLSANKKENDLKYKTPKQKVVDLFAEPSDDNQNATYSSASSGQKINRMANEDQLIRKQGTPALRTQPAPFIDLFAEPPEDLPSSTSSSLSSSHNIKRKIVNLFDDNDNSLTFAKEEQFIQPDNKDNEFLSPVATSKSISVTKSSKPLFDDSDDDDDFLKAFVKNSLSKVPAKSSLSQALLFDDENNDTAINTLQKTNENKNKDSEGISSGSAAGNLFDEMKTKDSDLFSNKVTTSESQIPTGDVFKTKTSSKSAHLDTRTAAEYVEKTRKQINLFDDLEEEDDIFSTKTKNKEETSKQRSVEKKNTFNTFEDKPVIKTVPNFENSIGNQLGKSHSVLDNNSVSNKNESSIAKDQTINTHFVSEAIDKPEDIQQLQVDKITHDKETAVESPKQGESDIVTTPQPAEIKAGSIPQENMPKIESSNKYEFSSILFLDEPPEDDDEFFETLAKTPSNSNSNYNTIDLENDIFEPDLPQIPVASTSNNQTDSVDNNFYAGLQLFSDIPPDDDGDAISGSLLNPVPDATQTKRLHSVFYDDFNETLMALNQKQIDKEIPKHSFFNDEPPPMTDNKSFPGEDLIDHRVPDKEQETISCDYKTKREDDNSNTEESMLPSNDKNSAEVLKKRPVSKLQMPHININVQALLPGASNALRKSKDDDKKLVGSAAPKEALGMPEESSNSSEDSLLPGASNAFLKSKEEDKKSIASSAPKNAAKQAVNLSGASNNDNTPRTSKTEHILPNLTKNRIKVPAARRPSTRRARQENYRKSFIEQQNILESDGDHPEMVRTVKTDTENVLSDTSQPQKTPKDSEDDIGKNNYSSPVVKPASTSILDDNKNQNASHLVRKTKDDSVQEAKSVRSEVVDSNISISNIDNTTGSALSSSISTEVSAKGCQEIEILNESLQADTLTLKSKHLNSSLFFNSDEEDDDDDDFFKRIKTTNILGNQKTKESGENVFTKSFLNPKDLPHSETNTNMAIAQEPQQSIVDHKEIAMRDSEKLATSQANQDQPTVDKKATNPSNQKANNSKSFLSDDDDEDLFKTSTAPSGSALSSKDQNNKAKLQFKSFLDSETDDESNVAGQRTTIARPATASLSGNLKTKNKNDQSAKKLFSGSETDSDDLFGKAAPAKVSIKEKSSTQVTTKPQTNQPVSKSTLFEGDSDSEDFLSPKSSLNKSVPKIATKTNTNLFSDLDSDEDDLFGSGTPKVIPANATNVKNLKSDPASMPSASAAERSKPQTVDDNPLADLL